MLSHPVLQEYIYYSHFLILQMRKLSTESLTYPRIWNLSVWCQNSCYYALWSNLSLETNNNNGQGVRMQYLSYSTFSYMFVSGCFSKLWLEGIIVWFRWVNYSKYKIYIILMKTKCLLGNPCFSTILSWSLFLVLFCFPYKLDWVLCSTAGRPWLLNCNHLKQLLSCTWQTHVLFLCPSYAYVYIYRHLEEIWSFMDESN